MKVLFILPRMVGGGVERMRLVIIQHLLERGINCILALRQGRGELLGDARAMLPVVELAPDGIHQFVPSLRFLIEREKPTHVVTAFPDVGFLAWCAMRMAGSRAAWVHSVHLTHSSVAARPGVLGRLKHVLESRCARFVFKRANRVVAVSDALVQEVEEMFRLEAGRVVRIYNPVVPDDELRRDDKIIKNRSGVFSILAIGRLEREKGFDVLIEAMKSVPLPWRLEIYGEGSERDRLEHMVLGSGLEKNILLRGFAESPLEMLRQADLFVLPSRFEGLANVIIEAMACRCQIVASDCPVGPSEILQEGRLGQLVPVGNVVALANAIRRVMDGSLCVSDDALLRRAADFSRSNGCRQWESVISGAGVEDHNVRAPSGN